MQRDGRKKLRRMGDGIDAARNNKKSINIEI